MHQSPTLCDAPAYPEFDTQLREGLTDAILEVEEWGP
jgi:hypothetical protein